MKTLWYALLVSAAIASAHAAQNEASASLYHLDAALTNQSGATHGLDVYRGRPVLISMFYGSCPMTCPVLIDTIRAIERSIPANQRNELRVLMISIDPDHDTPEALQKLARERRIDASRWTLARTDEKSVRKIAAVLDIQYRRLPNGGYNHSSIVTLLSQDGEIAGRSSVLGKADEALVAAIDQVAGTPRAVPSSRSAWSR